MEEHYSKMLLLHLHHLHYYSSFAFVASALLVDTSDNEREVQLEEELSKRRNEHSECELDSLP